jgi:hypothetical protein
MKILLYGSDMWVLSCNLKIYLDNQTEFKNFWRKNSVILSEVKKTANRAWKGWIFHFHDILSNFRSQLFLFDFSAEVLNIFAYTFPFWRFIAEFFLRERAEFSS